LDKADMQLVLTDPRFRLFWTGNVFNEMALLMHFTVHGYLALIVTNSPFWTGATSGFTGLALVAFSPIGGVLADRLDKRKLVVTARLVAAGVGMILAALVFTERIELWHILALSFLDGAMIAVKVPSRMAMTLDIAGRDRLLNATAAGFVSMTSMGIIVPLVGGQIGERWGIEWAYVIMGGAYFVSAVLLMLLKGPFKSEGTGDSPLQDLKSGAKFVFTTPSVRLLIVLGLTSEAFGWAHETMLPVMARDVLNIGLAGQGYLLSAGSVGALIASLVMSLRGDVKRKGVMLMAGYFGFGTFLILFAASPALGWLPLTLVLLGLAYASVMMYEAALGTLLQTTVPDAMRGRVLSFQTMTWGVTGTSGFHTGAIATLLGAPAAIAIGGGVLIANGLRVTRRMWGVETTSPEVARGD
jgi:MFS family permease